jgi:alkylated DNA repair dioxygenase AlkB
MDFAAMLKAEKAKAKAQAQSQDKNHMKSLPNLAADEQPHCVINNLESGMAYCSNFISEKEETELINDIGKMPPSQWVSLKQRALLNLGGVPHPSGSWSEDLPDFIQPLCERLVHLGMFKSCPNQVLLNEYRNGAGIDPHFDGPLFQPLVGIISLDSDAIISFLGKIEPSNHASDDVSGSSNESPEYTKVKSVVLRQRSLFIFSEEMYLNYMHGMPSSMFDIVDDTTVNIKEAKVNIGDVIQRGSRRLSITVRVLVDVRKHFSKYDVLSDEEKSEQTRRQSWWLASISEK